jgi:predicted dehydrogenase
MRIGLIGLGFMGATHAAAIEDGDGLELAAVADADPRRLTGDLSAIQGNLGGPARVFDFSRISRYENAFELLKDSNVEAVDICLPTQFHKPVVLAALRAGKHVLVEKPMALSREACDEMIAAAQAAGRTLMVAQVVRFFPAYEALYQLLRAKRLGPVRAAFFRRRCAAPGWQRWVYDAQQSGGGVFDLLIHDVDQCLRLFGPPQSVSATGCEDLERGIDQMTATLNYPDIGSVVVSGGWHHAGAYPFSMEFTVVCDGGTLEYSSDRRPLTLYRADGKEEAVEVYGGDAYQAELRYFADCCRDGKAPRLCPPEESAAAVELTLRMAAARKR